MEDISIGQELLNVPMGDMIREMAEAIADAQIQLDENSIEVAQMMGGLKTITDDNGNVTFQDSRIFFGHETMTLEQALSVYNTTSDEELRSALGAQYFGTTSGVYKNDIEEDTSATGTRKVYKVKTSSATKKILELSVPRRMSMLEAGFTPTFYQFVDNIIEVNIAISISKQTSDVDTTQTNSRTRSYSGRGAWHRGRYRSRVSKTVSTTQVNATYASKYNYSAEGSSLLRTKLTPIPPPAILEERIRLTFEQMKAESAS